MADEQVNETISALIDGELSETEMQNVIRRLRTQKEDRCCWHDYHLIGDALRNNLPPKIDHRLCERISTALLSEPDLQVIPPSPKSIRKKPNFVRPAVGFALAASVAIVGFVGFSMLAVDDQAGAVRVASVSPAPVMPVTEQNHFQQVRGLKWTEQQPAIQSKLNAYLHDHQQYAGAMAINGRLIPRAQFAVESQAYNQ